MIFKLRLVQFKILINKSNINISHLSLVSLLSPCVQNIFQKKIKELLILGGWCVTFGASSAHCLIFTLSHTRHRHIYIKHWTKTLNSPPSLPPFPSHLLNLYNSFFFFFGSAIRLIDLNILALWWCTQHPQSPVPRWINGIRES